VPSDSAAIAQLLRQIDPDLRLVRAWNLTGGVSAQVTAVTAARPDAPEETLVVRQYGAANLRSDQHVATHEFALLTLLHAAGLPVPRPRHADESAAILPAPCLVIEYIDGQPVTDPGQMTAPLTEFTGQLAAALARLHTAAFTLADAPCLADSRVIADRTVETWPASPDESLCESAVRTALARLWPPPLLNHPVLLHGDYWPGNTLWRDGTLVGIVDWEDAVLGDPLHDLGNTRMEICMTFGAAASSDFTRQYCALRPSLDMTALPHWDLYAALRHAGRMAGWGLTPADRRRLEAGHQDFARAALAQAGALADTGRRTPRCP
jgi:aminoglycoside phosphotransferase (APT) family kinase protein